jgi:hypothetical protein
VHLERAALLRNFADLFGQRRFEAARAWTEK